MAQKSVSTASFSPASRKRPEKRSARHCGRRKWKLRSAGIDICVFCVQTLVSTVTFRVTDSDFCGQFQRLARSVALQNTLSIVFIRDRLTHSQHTPPGILDAERHGTSARPPRADRFRNTSCEGGDAATSSTSARETAEPLEPVLLQLLLL